MMMNVIIPLTCLFCFHYRVFTRSQWSFVVFIAANWRL